jgi:hypothetical protein
MCAFASITSAVAYPAMSEPTQVTQARSAVTASYSLLGCLDWRAAKAAASALELRLSLRRMLLT